MLYIIVGPSGSGKTSFIELALAHIHNAKVICVDVFSPHQRSYESNLGRNSVSCEKFELNMKEGSYSITNAYDDCKYGYTIPYDYNCSDVIYLLDYPGEYPQCLDLNQYDWKGIMILPPSAEELEKRLQNSNRANRIESAINEYRECLLDIAKGELIQNWQIIYNIDMGSLLEGVKTLQSII